MFEDAGRKNPALYRQGYPDILTSGMDGVAAITLPGKGSSGHSFVQTITANWPATNSRDG